MAKVEIKTRNKIGGEFSPIKETGNAVVFIDGTDFISVDAFMGRGDTYKKRDKAEIEISIGNTRWKGTAEDLYELLNK